MEIPVITTKIGKAVIAIAFALSLALLVPALTHLTCLGLPQDTPVAQEIPEYTGDSCLVH